MISRVTDKIYRGPRPDPTDYLQLKNMGVTHVLNLEDETQAIYADKNNAIQMGLFWQSVRMSEIWRPTKRDLLYCVSILEDPTNLPIYVHCKHGEDRTGYVIAAYREVVQKWTFKMAYKEAKDMGHKWWFAPYLLLWPKSLKELIRR